MSCGDPHDVDCVEVIERVYLYLDGEIDLTDHEHIREHLDECSPCLRQFGIEAEVKALVSRSCGGDKAPESLRSRLRVKLDELCIDITTTSTTSLSER